MKSFEFTDNNFEEVVLKSEKPVLVDFSADWCPPCRAMSPVIDTIASELAGNAAVGKLDVDANPIFAARFGVRNLLTFLVFKNGKLVERMVGAVPKNVLLEKVHASGIM